MAEGKIDDERSRKGQSIAQSAGPNSERSKGVFIPLEHKESDPIRKERHH